MEKLSFLLLILTVYYVNGDTISLDIIKKAIASLGNMLISNPPGGDNLEDRKSVFQLYTCLSLTKDLELLLLNHTEVFILDPKQSCCCRVDSEGQVHNITFKKNLTLNTDLFIHSLVIDLIQSDPNESLTLTHGNDKKCHGESTTDPQLSAINESDIQLTETENAVQIITRYIIKRWALTSLKDNYPPVFELYTCLSLLKETELHLANHLNLLKKLHIEHGENYTPCKCDTSLDESCKLFIDSKLMTTPYELTIYNAIKQFPVMPEIFWNNLNFSLN